MLSINSSIREQLLYYRHLIELEFKGKTPDEIYELSFSRLLKADPVRAAVPERSKGAPLMLGTDERDLFVPFVKDVLSQMPEGARVLDVGAGDGQTFKNFLGCLPAGTSVDIIEPNKTYANSYASVISESERNIRLRNKSVATFGEYLSYSKNKKKELYDTILCLHSVYYMDDMDEFLGFLGQSLKPGGSAIVVLADEENSYTGKVYHTYLGSINKQKSAQFLKTIQERKRKILSEDKSLSGYELSLSNMEIQESRLYGHDWGDIIALGFITGLPFSEASDISHKIDQVCDLLVTGYSSIGVALELKTPRRHMLSVREPQIVARLCKS
jgi:SAM-dependent methyltransferase